MVNSLSNTMESLDKFIIRGGTPLNGEITPSGSKNAALAILAASLLSDETVVLHNVPQIEDIKTFILLLKSLGVDIEVLAGNTVKIARSKLSSVDSETHLSNRNDASILLLAPFLLRRGTIMLHPPEGDVVGRRRMDTHVLVMTRLGAMVSFDKQSGSTYFSAPQLKGNVVFLDQASVTATQNAVMAAVKANGYTIIKNAACEPQVQELCLFLNNLGAKIDNIGSHTLFVQGVQYLKGGEHTINPDYLETVGLIIAAAITHGEITIRNAKPDNFEMIALILERLGIFFDVQDENILVPRHQQLTIQNDLGDALPKIHSMPWPGFPSDLMSSTIVAATQSRGSVLFHDWMYASRFFFLDKLVAMGANIVLADPHRCIVAGPTKLYGEKLDSPDIRAGMALVLAALVAKGESVIGNVIQIDRGFEKLDEKLKALGASIERINDSPTS